MDIDYRTVEAAILTAVRERDTHQTVRELIAHVVEQGPPDHVVRPALWRMIEREQLQLTFDWGVKLPT